MSILASENASTSAGWLLYGLEWQNRLTVAEFPLKFRQKLPTGSGMAENRSNVSRMKTWGWSILNWKPRAYSKARSAVKMDSLKVSETSGSLKLFSASGLLLYLLQTKE